MLGRLKSTLRWYKARARNDLVRLTGGAHCVWPVRAELGEGPVWASAAQSVLFLDVPGRRICQLSLTTNVRRVVDIEGEATAIVPDAAPGQFLLILDGKLHRLDECLRIGHPILDLQIDTRVYKTNDAKCDPYGRLWVGVMKRDQPCPDGGRLLIVTPNGDLQTVGGDFALPNGPAFSPSGDAAYCADSGQKLLYRYPLSENGEPGQRDVFYKFQGSEGTPDGMTVDRDGDLWVAHYDGGCVSRFSPKGNLLERVRLPVSFVTSIAIGSAELDRMYITTAGWQGALRRSPFAGGLFQLSLQVPGLPAARFERTFDSLV